MSIEKFESYERAALFVEKKRAEGYEAEIVNENVGFLWGSRTVGGFRVQVSEECGEFPEQDEPADSFFTVAMRYAVLIFLALGLLIAVISVINSLGASLKFAIGICFVAAVSIGSGYLMFRHGFPIDKSRNRNQQCTH